MNWNYFKLVLVAIIGVSLFAACEKETNNPTLPYENVFGSWKWIQTTHGFTGVTIIVDSVNYTQTLDIDKDDNYTWTKNDTVIIDTTFIIMQDSLNNSDDGEYIIEFPNDTLPDQTFYIANGDTLFLSNDCADCDSFIFVRK